MFFSNDSCCVKTSKVSNKWNWFVGDLGLGFGVFFASSQVSQCHSLFQLCLNSKDREHDFLGSSLTEPGFLGRYYQCCIRRCECTGYFSVLPLCPPCLVSCYQAAWNDLSVYQPVLYRQPLRETQKLEWPRIDSPDTIWKSSSSSGGRTLLARRKLLHRIFGKTFLF